MSNTINTKTPSVTLSAFCNAVKPPQMKWIYMGMVAVDSAQLMIGDPCYFIGKDSDVNKTYSDYGDFFARSNSDDPYSTIIPFSRGHEGAGVAMHTTYGDGCYPVYGLYTDSDAHDKPHAMVVLTGDVEMSDDGQIVPDEE